MSHTATVVDGEPKTNYYVCVQPRCDSARLKKTRTFPFLPLNSADNGFDVVLKNNEGGFCQLKIGQKLHSLKMFDLSPGKDDEGKILAQEEEGLYNFLTQDDEKLTWIGDLKFEHAQRIINKFAASISRVGLNESEWLRRSAAPEE